VFSGVLVNEVNEGSEELRSSGVVLNNVKHDLRERFSLSGFEPRSFRSLRSLHSLLRIRWTYLPLATLLAAK